MDNLIINNDDYDITKYSNKKEELLNIFRIILNKLNNENLDINHKKDIYIKFIKLIHIDYLKTTERLIEITPNFLGWTFFFNTLDILYNSKEKKSNLKIIEIYKNIIIKNIKVDISKLNINKLNLKNIKKLEKNNYPELILNLNYIHLLDSNSILLNLDNELIKDIIISIFYPRQNIFNDNLDYNSTIMKDIRLKYGLMCIESIILFLKDFEYKCSYNNVTDINVILLLLNNKIIEDMNK